MCQAQAECALHLHWPSRPLTDLPMYHRWREAVKCLRVRQPDASPQAAPHTPARHHTESQKKNHSVSHPWPCAHTSRDATAGQPAGRPPTGTPLPHRSTPGPILRPQPFDPILWVQSLGPHTTGTTPPHTPATTFDPILWVQPLRPQLWVQPHSPHTRGTTPMIRPHTRGGPIRPHTSTMVQSLRPDPTPHYRYNPLPHTVLWVQPRQPHTIPSTHTMGTIVYNLSDPIHYHTILWVQLGLTPRLQPIRPHTPATTLRPPRYNYGYNPSDPILQVQPSDPTLSKYLWVQTNKPIQTHTRGTTFR